MKKIERENVLHILKSHKPDLARNYGLLKLGVFGSVARNMAEEGSDIDIVVETKVPNLLRMVNLKEDLEELLHSKVDLTVLLLVLLGFGILFGGFIIGGKKLWQKIA